MKKLILPTLLLAAVLMSSYTEAQVRLNVNLNIGRPAWGLPDEYEGDYYYLPEIDSYYDIPHRSFIYLSDGRWVIGASLPAMYSDYDLYGGYKVAINEPRPWYRCDYYRDRYRDYYNTYRRPVVVDNRYPAYGGDRYGYGGKWKDKFYNGHDNRKWDRGDRDDDDRGGRWGDRGEREREHGRGWDRRERD
ncbi:hypothetical protein SAMN05444410_11578 [Hydrobacter penzbergensis]|uniref:YXWGXW repeat-containing protein n=1 Tax=Hydrobacter penzbergensis TaxID=1235997 RepID=A0A8X8LEW8_9BACT|nr:hypothetical protein [Hydrobacter penzbergensis]SDX42151.1 hypothetical protein SAMN05444410_11578 [Hydrobacter penzbergensis]